MTDYSKSAMKEQESWQSVASKLFNGFCIRRMVWGPEQYAFMVKSAQYTALDYTTGFVEEFLVRRVGHRDVIYFPSDEDREATDWQVYTRQECHSFPRIQERSTKMVDVTPAE